MSYEVIPFKGLNGRTETPETPDHFDRRFDDDDPVTFSTVYHDLPRIKKVRPGFENPMTGEWVAADDEYAAFVNPDELMSGNVNPDDVLWNIASNQYAPLNPVEFYHPLEDKLMEEDLTDVFGYTKVVNNGARAYTHLMFDSDMQDLPERAGDALYTGLRSGYSHDGSVTMFVEAFAQDTTCENSIERLTDRRTRRHVKSSEEEDSERVKQEIQDNLWAPVLESYGLVPDILGDMIREALEFDLELIETPFDDWTELYKVAGFPEYMAQSAASHARSRAEEPWTMTAWDLHSGATFALTHTFTGNEESDTRREYVQIANDLLQNPVQFIDRLTTRYEQLMQAQDDEQDVYDEDGLEQLEEMGEGDEIETLKEVYNERQDEMETLLLEGEQ